MAFAGVTLESSFARFKASMAAFNAVTAPFCPLGRWDSAFMVGTRGSCERTVRVVRKVSDPNRAERQFCHDMPRANRSRGIVFAGVALKDVCDPSVDRPRSLLTPLNWNPTSNSEAGRGVRTRKECIFPRIAGATLYIHLRLPFYLVFLVTSSETHSHNSG